jgi:DNA-binding transcriptional MerR regulator
MLIKEVCEACGVTRKAVEYYERQGLMHPEVLENGYRSYGSKDIATLKEIALLRRCGAGISDIRAILNSSAKAAALARYRRLNDLKIRRLRAVGSILDDLIGDFDVEKGYKRLNELGDEGLTIQEKLVLAFPGNYGLFLSLHFGRFLNEPVQSAEQRLAYERIVAYLDSVPVQISDELSEYLEEALPPDVERYEDNVSRAMEKALRDPSAYFREMHVEEYIAYRTSEEFRQSPAGKMALLIDEFQRNSGYREVFLESLKVLSPAYLAYCERLQAANASFLAEYPRAGSLSRQDK